MHNKPFKILSIDGGGIKGLYSASILARLEEKAGVKSGDCFDMICGTSTGGLIALGLANEMSANDLVELYLKNGKGIFPTAENRQLRWIQRKIIQVATQTFFWGKFGNKNLKKILESTFGETTLGQLQNLVLIPSFNLTSGMPRTFKFPHKEGDFFMDKNIKLVDAALATSAAPTYFPIHSIDDTLFIDGGVWANNPSLCGLLEAIKYFVGEGKEYSHVEILSIASISQSSGWTSGVRKKRSFIGWREKLIQTSMDGQAFFTHFFLDTAIHHFDTKSRYVRIESPKLSSDQMKVLAMDRADLNVLTTLKSLGNQDGYTASNNAKVMQFFKTKKTYLTQ
ncbi:CBASS cGAMP-activated phospholipase [Algoriphagus aquimarinus]|uniref:Phospholipase n=1 Tax=Algoriphagus aquimarinus TaxID=237018 RepID=A0A5C7B6G7_9BACT|nr:CBASS cGAMP-activated phospholipase [Algoriphagus aquimarinus]TXE13472.1 phospholipase [Algoriphagus aquimarinus]